jgi:hypothetical protein
MKLTAFAFGRLMSLVSKFQFSEFLCESLCALCGEKTLTAEEAEVSQRPQRICGDFQ